MSKVFIRLKDRSTIFHDASQDVTVTGTQVKEAEETSKVLSAIKHGLLEVVKPEEVKEAEKPKTDEASTTEKPADPTEKPKGRPAKE
nr:MAG TPA: hypothetical protein [Herelleviridae sp.]